MSTYSISKSLALTCAFVLVHALPARAQCPNWSGAFGANGLDTGPQALCVFDDGSGPALYAGGNFTIAGGISAESIAKWNGTIWSPLGPGLNGIVHALAVYDDGFGPALYAGGEFSAAGI